MRLASIIFFCVAGTANADDPKPKAETLYFPVKVGATWVREVKVGERAFKITERTTKVEQKDGMYRVTIESVEDFEGSKPRATVFEVSEKGLARVSGKDAEDAPLHLLKLGFKVGETWSDDRAGPGGQVGKATHTIGKTEEVKVAAGTYRAIRVDTEIKFETLVTKMTTWYAAGVGVVKLEAANGDRKQTTVLESFTPAK